MANMYAYADDFGLITVWMNRNFYQGRTDSFYLTDDEGFYKDLLITGVEDHGTNVKYTLTCPADLPFGVKYMVHESHGLAVPVIYRLIVRTKRFNEMFAYDGDDLGYRYTPESTQFALWAPTAVSVMLKVREGLRTNVYTMYRGDKGVWRTKVTGDLKKAFYTYLIDRNGELVESIDPYAYSSNANSRESAVIDLNEIEQIVDYAPRGDIKAETDAIIYECNVRDMTSHVYTGTQSHGTFLALTEDHTSWKGLPTGLAYIKSLGVTHVQFMPVMDFATVDENRPKRSYNWGYDPVQYLVPEGSYSSDPDNPYARVRELRKLVTCLHRNNIRVILDVVFNHMYGTETSSFDKTVPYYYFRYNASGFLSNGSYCGNDVDSTQPMVRKYILHVIRELMRVYCVDGFRFDLMGILDTDTMNEIHKTVKRIKKDGMVYGEGWDMPTSLDQGKKASIANQFKMPGVGHFNDTFRDVVKGRTSDDQKYDKGYVTGDLDRCQDMCGALTGNTSSIYYKRFDSPVKSINALETHDNSTVWDKMKYCCGTENHDIRLTRQKMLIACTLVAQGVPFLHAGQEYCGTKNGNTNSYASGDEINQMNWDRASLNKDIVEYTRKCIAMRKHFAAFRLSTAEQIDKCVHFSIAEGNLVVYDIDYDDPGTRFSHFKVIINPSFNEREFYYQEDWTVIFDENGNNGHVTENRVHVPSLSVIVTAR